MHGFSLRPSPAVGRYIDERYRVEGFLGEGGTAEVFLARDEQEGEIVVVKRMKASVAETPELRERFLMEARALAVVDHPGVIRVKGIREPLNEPPYLTLEALRGETLGDYLKREEVMAVDQSLLLIREAVVALKAVHEAGVVHRDIKPDNLFLVGPVGEAQSVKVLDFGMARLKSEEYDEESTSILGTAQYMAPEQILVEPVDARTDIYALGVVLFRMLTGHLPFEGNTKHDLLRHQLFSPVPPVSWLHDEVSEAVDRIVHKATRKCPAARFQDMHEMSEAIDGIFGEQKSPSSRRLPPVIPSPDPACPDPDVYKPVSVRGRQAATVLATEFGIYSRPHSPTPPIAD